MAGRGIYRDTCVGKALQSALEEMEVTEQLPSHLVDVAMGAFDDAVLQNLKPQRLIPSTVRPSMLEGEIREGVVESYRFVDNQWTFHLAHAIFKGAAFAPGRGVLHVDRIQVIAADARGMELPLGGAGPSAAGAAWDAQAMPQFDGSSCEPERIRAAHVRPCTRGLGRRAEHDPDRGLACLVTVREPVVPQGDGEDDDDLIEEEDDDDDWEEAPGLPVSISLEASWAVRSRGRKRTHLLASCVRRGSAILLLALTKPTSPMDHRLNTCPTITRSHKN